jgi:hypothetical protein
MSLKQLNKVSLIDLAQRLNLRSVASDIKAQIPLNTLQDQPVLTFFA